MSEETVNIIKNTGTSQLLQILLLRDPAIRVEVMSEIGASLLGYVIDFMGGIKKLRLLMVWSTRESMEDAGRSIARFFANPLRRPRER